MTEQQLDALVAQNQVMAEQYNQVSSQYEQALENLQIALIKMQNIQGASAFAITLEPQGGSENPTLEAMYVMGNV